MRARFEKTSQLPHPGLKGRERENILKDFLREYCLKRLALGSGLIMAANGQLSEQQDIIVYDALNCPLIYPGEEIQIFPIESVYATIQVKSRLGRSELGDAFKNIASVKALPTVGGYTMKTLTATAVVGPAPPPPLGVVYSFKSIGLGSLKRCLEELHSRVNLRFWINMICVHDNGIIFFGDKRSLQLKRNMKETDKMEMLSSGKDTLFAFYVILIGFLSRAEEMFPTFWRYARSLLQLENEGKGA